MTEPKIALRLERGDGFKTDPWRDHSTAGRLFAGDELAANLWLKNEHWAALESALTENAGLREALEASEAECAKLILRERNVWDRINTWNDDPVTRLQAFAITHEDLDAAIKERDAMPVLPGRFGLGADGNIEDLVHTVLGAAEQYLRETCPGGPWEPSEGSDE